MKDRDPGSHFGRFIAGAPARLPAVKGTRPRRASMEETLSKILLVEDNEINRDMLSRRLAKKGFQVVLEIDAAGAWEKALAEKTDLILMDVELLPAAGREPGPDGWDATRRLKAMPET